MSNVLLNLKGKTETELLDLKLEIDADSSRIKQQIQDARSRAADGEYSDRTWWRKAHAALKIKGLQSQQVQNELTKMKRKKQNSLERYFMEIAQEDLPPEVFSKILEQAKIEAEEDF